MTALRTPPMPDEEGAGMTRVLPFPSACLGRRRRARIEAIVAHLIDLLDALDAADADREPEPDEDDDGEASAAPLSLNNGGLAPTRRIRLAGGMATAIHLLRPPHRNLSQGRTHHG